MKRIITTFLVATIVLGCIVTNSIAAGYPAIFPNNYNIKLAQNEISLISFTVFPEWTDEYVYFNIYKGDSTDKSKLIYSDSKELHNYSKKEESVSFLITPRNWEIGTYTLEYYMTYYALFSWREIPIRKTLEISVVKPCEEVAHIWNNEIVYEAPTCADAGVILCACENCGYYHLDMSTKLEHTWDTGKVMKKAALTRPGNAIFTCVECGEEKEWEITPILTDVVADSYYEESVIWAYDNDITKGTSESTFTPEAECSRGQIITFLYRAAGSPEVDTNNTVSDIHTDDFYYSAVQWAKGKKMFDEDLFYPSAPCTRLMAVDFIWRYFGKQSADGKSGFTDIALGTEPAVNWAVKNGITSGTGETTFSPHVICTRGQITTLLYRAFTTPKPSEEPETEEVIEQESAPQKDGFNSEINFPVSIGSFSFEIPLYWSRYENDDSLEAYVAEKDDAMLVFTQIPYDGDMNGGEALGEMAEEAENDNAKMLIQEPEYIATKTGIAGLRYQFSYKEKETSESIIYQFFAIPDDNNKCALVIYLGRSDRSAFAYDEDFEKMISSVSLKD